MLKRWQDSDIRIGDLPIIRDSKSRTSSVRHHGAGKSEVILVVLLTTPVSVGENATTVRGIC